MSYMLGNVHVYVEPSQPATKFVDRNSGKAHWQRYPPRSLIWCECCRRKRWAKYVRVQVYYDHINRFCADGHGCKVAKARVAQ